MESIDFSNWAWTYTNEKPYVIHLTDGSTVRPGESITFHGTAQDSKTGAEQFLDSYANFQRLFPPGEGSVPLPEMDLALRQAHEQADPYDDGNKRLIVQVDNIPGFDPSVNDGRLNATEVPEDLITRGVPGSNTNGDFAKILEPSQNELPPQNPPTGKKTKRSSEEERHKTTGADPVDLFTGEFFLEKIDFTLPSIGFPFILVRSYKSGRPFFGPFGYNWDHNYNVYLRQLSNGKIAISTGRLQEDIYADSGDGVLFTSPRGIFAKLERQPLGSQFEFLLTFRNGTKHSFSRPVNWSHPEKIPLVKIEDSNGNAQQLIYDNKDRLAQVIDTVGREIDFIYGSCDLLEAIRPEFLQIPGESPVEIKYFHSNNIEHLSAVVTLPTPDFPDGLMTCYEYDEHQPLGEQRSNITRVIDSKGQIIVENVYGSDTDEASFNRVVMQYFMGGEYLFKYKNIRFIPPLDEHINDAYLEVELYEPEKPLRLYTFNFRGNLLDERFRLCADGSYRVWAQAYRYNKNGQITEFYYPNGMAEIFTYDENNPDPLSQGNLLKIEQKSQPNRLLTRKIREFTYEPLFKKIKTSTDEAGKTTTFVYDYEINPLLQKGNLKKIQYPDVTQPDGVVQSGCETAFKHDQFGQIIEWISPENRRVSFEYHLQGNGAGLIKKRIVHNSDSFVSESFEYDSLGNIARYIDGRGNDVFLTYNLLNQLTTVKTARVNDSRAIHKFEYNEDRMIAREYIPRGSYSDSVINDAWIVHEYEYDALSFLTKEIRNSNTVAPQITHYNRDIHGRVIKLINALGQETALYYDERNLILKEISFANDSFPLESNYSYDRSGNLVRFVGPNGSYTSFDYSDSFSRLKSKTNRLGVVKNFFYGPLDKVLRTSISDNNSNISLIEKYEYDEKGRLVSQDFNGLTRKFYYDRDDLLTKIVNHLGETVKYTYDGFGRISTVEDPVGILSNPVLDENGNKIGASVRFTSTQTGNSLSFSEKAIFDERNRLVGVVDSFGNTLQQIFDDRDLRTNVIDSYGNQINTYFDVNGLPIKTALIIGGIETPINVWRRDIVGRVTDYEDAEGNITHYEYDNRNNLISATYPDGSVVEKTFNSDNLLVSEKDANGSVMRFDYNQNGQLERMAVQAGPNVAQTPDVNYSYDGFGRMTRIETIFDVIERKYDFFNRIIEEKQNSSVIKRIYNDIANTTTLVYPDGREDLYSLDSLGRLQSIVFKKKGALDLLTFDFSEGTKLVECFYDGILLLSKRFANGVTTNYAYDKDAKLSGYTIADSAGNIIDGETYLYDGEKRKRLINRRLPLEFLKLFRYDTLSRLTDSFTLTPQVNIPTDFADQAAVDTFVDSFNPNNSINYEQYSLSSNDKRSSWQKNNLLFLPTYNNLIQLIALQLPDGTINHYKYDLNGNRTEDGKFVYQFDAFDNLVKIIDKTDGHLVTELSYDGLGRIVRNKSGNTSTHYVFDGMRAVQEQNDNSVTQNTFGSELDEMVIRSSASNNLFCHFSDSSNLNTITSKSGDAIQYLDYGAFGEPTLFDNRGGNLELVNAKISPIFGGRPYLGLLGQYEFRKRFYDPLVGCFLQRDTYNYFDSSNPYLYCKHNPVCLTDPNGKIAPIIVGIAAAAALGAGSGAIFGSIRQGLQISTGYTDEYGNVKEEFDWNEFGMNLGIGGALGIGVFLFPPLAIGMTGIGLLGGASEIHGGNPIVGAFDIGTSIFGTRGLGNFKGTTVVSRFNKLGLDTLISFEGFKLHSNLALGSLFGFTRSNFAQQRLEGSFRSLTRTAELKVAMERVYDPSLRVGEEFVWKPEFLRDITKTAGETDVRTNTIIDEIKTGNDFMDGLVTTYNRLGEVEHLGQLDKLSMFFPDHQINLWVKFRYFTDPRSTRSGKPLLHREFKGRLDTLKRDFPSIKIQELSQSQLSPPKPIDFSSPLAPLVNSDISKLSSIFKGNAKSPSNKN